MKAIDIFNNLKSAGYVVGFDDHDILIDLPGGGTVTLDDKLRADILHHKPEILFYLRSREYNQLTEQARRLAEYLNSSSVPLPARKARLPEYESMLDEIGELQPWVDYYQSSGLDRWYKDGYLLFFSDLLGEIIVVVRDTEIKLPAGCTAYPCYQFKEVEPLDGKDDQTIRAAHKTKKVFSGRIENVKGAKK